MTACSCEWSPIVGPAARVANRQPVWLSLALLTR